MIEDKNKQEKELTLKKLQDFYLGNKKDYLVKSNDPEYNKALEEAYNKVVLQGLESDNLLEIFAKPISITKDKIINEVESNTKYRAENVRQSLADELYFRSKDHAIYVKVAPDFEGIRYLSFGYITDDGLLGLEATNGFLNSADLDDFQNILSVLKKYLPKRSF